jgi:hypothetical protein
MTTWWYVADLLGVFAFLPALAVCLRRLERPLALADKHTTRIRDDVTAIAAALDGLPGLAETQMLTGSGQPGVVRYTEALRGTQ